MQTFTIKTVGKTNIYELDETKKTLLITRKKYGRTVRQENFDLQQLDPEYGEFAPETPRIFPLLLAWCVIILGFGLVGTVLFFALQSPWDKTLIGFIVFILAVLIIGPVPCFRQSLFYIFRDRAREQTGNFYFENSTTRSAFYNDNVYYLIVYKTFTDIRFVGAPPSSIGKFGADTDNWMWPRHTGAEIRHNS